VPDPFVLGFIAAAGLIALAHAVAKLRR